MFSGYSGLIPEGIEGAEYLAELALDLRNCWDHGADKIWKRLDADLWDVTRNPWVVLQTVSRTRLETACADPEFRHGLEDLVMNRRRRAAAPSWFQRAHGALDRALTRIAYVSMAFGLGAALPIYSGRLGNVAGDQLKAADELGVPVLGIGLLYQRGYFRQFIDSEGNQTALYPYNDPGQMPIVPVREKSGEWLRLEVRLPYGRIWLRTWQAKIGRVTLFLLDSNDPANLPVHRGITSELYGGGPELRLQQEMVLGIGGWRLLRVLGMEPEVCHLNEGHAAFAVLERARTFMADSGKKFAAALAVTRAGNLFTTHTPVPAGFDRFPPDLLLRYLGFYALNGLGISEHELLALGRRNPDDSDEPFNMAYLAIRGSGAINAVSRLHGVVSRTIFQPLFPRWPEREVPIGHVTNGVHAPSWDSPEADRVWTEACGPDRWRGTQESIGAKIHHLSANSLWEMRAANRHRLVQYVRARFPRSIAASGHQDVEWAENVLDPNTLTLAFARRFATYKRPNLLLHDPGRLARILSDPHRPVQLIVAGKAHPQDEPGKAMVKEWLRFMQRRAVRSHAVFLADYDMLLAEYLVQGADVWINTPRRPWEACGTSGMKVLVNGGLNLSELDGWWAEAYRPEVGWALGDGKYHGEDPAWDAAEADHLYSLLENEIVPSFYDRDAAGVPVHWITKIRESMARLTPEYSANRTVREYTEKYYIPAMKSYRARAADRGAAGEWLLDREAQLRRHWQAIYFGNVGVETSADRHRFRVQVYLDALDPELVRVELYANPRKSREQDRWTMKRGEPLVGANQGWTYAADVPADRPAADYTPRAVGAIPGVSSPLELQWIKWER